MPSYVTVPGLKLTTALLLTSTFALFAHVKCNWLVCNSAYSRLVKSFVITGMFESCHSQSCLAALSVVR